MRILFTPIVLILDLAMIAALVVLNYFVFNTHTLWDNVTIAMIVLDVTLVVSYVLKLFRLKR